MASAKPSRPGNKDGQDDPRVPAEEEFEYGRRPFEPTQAMRRGRRAPAAEDLDSGPRIGEGGEYLPAAYKRSRVEGRDEKGRPIRHDIIRQDF